VLRKVISFFFGKALPAVVVGCLVTACATATHDDTGRLILEPNKGVLALSIDRLTSAMPIKLDFRKLASEGRKLDPDADPVEIRQASPTAPLPNMTAQPHFLVPLDPGPYALAGISEIPVSAGVVSTGGGLAGALIALAVNVSATAIAHAQRDDISFLGEDDAVLPGTPIFHISANHTSYIGEFVIAGESRKMAAPIKVPGQQSGPNEHDAPTGTIADSIEARTIVGYAFAPNKIRPIVDRRGLQTVPFDQQALGQLVGRSWVLEHYANEDGSSFTPITPVTLSVTQRAVPEAPIPRSAPSPAVTTDSVRQPIYPTGTAPARPAPRVVNPPSFW
jgi:hypothetical protein